mgnify:CR=1 FL=1
MTPTAATLEISMLHAESNVFNFSEIAADLATRKLPLEAVTRLQGLWDTSKIIAGEVITTGRIIVIKIWEFIKANPNMAIGMVIGAAIGALVGLIPFIGAWLAPIAMAIGATVGGLTGGRMDDIASGIAVTNTMFEDLISAAKKFYALLAEIFNALKDNYFAGEK